MSSLSFTLLSQFTGPVLSLSGLGKASVGVSLFFQDSWNKTGASARHLPFQPLGARPVKHNNCGVNIQTIQGVNIPRLRSGYSCIMGRCSEQELDECGLIFLILTTPSDKRISKLSNNRKNLSEISCLMLKLINRSRCWEMNPWLCWPSWFA